jgi:hypothetical protein
LHVLLGDLNGETTDNFQTTIYADAINLLGGNANGDGVAAYGNNDHVTLGEELVAIRGSVTSQ